jgi:hypothetical protein
MAHAVFRLALDVVRGILFYELKRGLFIPFLLPLVMGCVNDVRVLTPSATPSFPFPNGPRPSLLYRVDENSGTRLLDSSGSGQLLHLDIQELSMPQWQASGLRFDGTVWAVGAAPPTEFMNACRRSGEMTVEVWLTPDPQPQEVMRRIVTLSGGNNDRNFTLGIGGLPSEGPIDAYSYRLRTSSKNNNGLPALYAPAGSVQAALTHVVALRNRAGKQQIFINGGLVAETTNSGELDDWSTQFKLALGNELNNSDSRRVFVGVLHQVALYAEAFTTDDVLSHFQAGPDW